MFVRYRQKASPKKKNAPSLVQCAERRGKLPTRGPQMKKKSVSGLAFVNPHVLTAHRNQSEAGFFRMPAFLGMLLCVATVFAFPGTAFSQVRQGVFPPTEIGRE